MRPRIALADDHALILEGIRKLLEREFEVVATALDGRELLDAVEKLSPDVVLLDIWMPVLNGIETARRVRQTYPETRIIMISQHTERSFLEAAFAAGADAYVIKHSSAAELSGAIRSVIAGRAYISPMLTHGGLLSGLDPRRHSQQLFASHLTPRQREVLQLIAEGKSAKEMAHALGVSQKTIEFHKANLMEIVGLRTTAELTRYALQQGLADPAPPGKRNGRHT
jgi:DNA-binding NarL/FixJ family response regulator